mgnify:CR=1 FL=1
MSKRVLSVGNCGPDHAALERYLTRHFPVEITTSHQLSDTLDRLRTQAFDLVLINRKLDADYSCGLKILKAIKDEPAFAKTPVMIVTNYPEHQEAAVAAGAAYGFGKLEYDKPETLERLKPYLSE